MEDKKDQYFNISKQIGATYFFTFLIILFQPFLIALLTRVLSIEEYGIYSLLVVTITLFSLFFRLGTNEYIKTKIPGLEEKTRIRTIITLLVFKILFLISMALLLYLFKDLIINILDIGRYTHLWTLSIFLIIFITFYEIIDVYLLSIKKIFIKSFLGFLAKCFWILLLLLLFIIFGDFSLNGVFISWFIGISLILIISLYFIRHEIILFIKQSMDFNYERLKSALKFSLVIIFINPLSLSIDFVDRYLINFFLGKTQVAIYSLAYGIIAILITVPLIFQQVIQPFFTEKWNLNENPSIFFNIMIKYTFMIVLPAITGMFILRKEIISLIAGPKYIAAAPIITILLLFPLLSVFVELFKKTMFLRDKLKHALIVILIGAITNFVLDLILIPRIGAIAAAYSTATSHFVMLLILFKMKPSRTKFQMDYLKLGRILVASICMGLIIININPIHYWSKILVIVLGIVIYSLFLFIFHVFNKEEKELFSYILKKFINKIHISI